MGWGRRDGVVADGPEDASSLGNFDADEEVQSNGYHDGGPEYGASVRVPSLPVSVDGN